MKKTNKIVWFCDTIFYLAHITELVKHLRYKGNEVVIYFGSDTSVLIGVDIAIINLPIDSDLLRQIQSKGILSIVFVDDLSEEFSTFSDAEKFLDYLRNLNIAGAIVKPLNPFDITGQIQEILRFKERSDVSAA